MIIKKKSGAYRVVSSKGRNLGESKTLKEAKDRLRQVEFFKYLSRQKNKQ